MFWEFQLSNMPSDENPAFFLLWQHLIHCTPSPALGTWNMWNNHHSQCAISGISNLKKIPNLHFCWCYKENKNQIFMLIKDDKKDLLFSPIRKAKWVAMGTKLLPKMHRGRRNNHWAHCASCSHNLQNKWAWNNKSSSLNSSGNEIKMNNSNNDYFGLLLH